MPFSRLAALAAAVSTSIFAAIGSKPALAADLPVYAPYASTTKPTLASWTGFNIGAHAGLGAYNINPEDTGIGLTGNGGLIGGTVGFDFQAAGLVFGVAVDGTIGSTKRDDTASGSTLETGVDRLFSARGRVGYASGPLMVYATAGYTIARATITASDTSGGVTITEKVSLDPTGIVLGGGVDWRLTESISWRTEALYYDLSETFIDLSGDRFEMDVNLTTVRTGISFRF